MIGLNNKKIGFIVDSSSNIKPDSIEDVKVVPLGVSVNDKGTIKTYKDGIDFNSDDLKVILSNNGGDIKTSQASMPDMMLAAEEMSDKYDEIFVLPIHKSLSGNYNTWNIIKDDFPKLHVLMTYDIGQSFVWTINQIKEYLSHNECDETKINELINNEILPNRVGWLLVANLDQLVKGGRVNALKAAFAKLFKVKPIILFSKNGLDFMDKVRNFEQYFKVCDEHLNKNYPGKKIKRVILFIPEGIEGELSSFQLEFKNHYGPDLQCETAQFPTVVVCHTGLEHVAYYVELE